MGKKIVLLVMGVLMISDISYGAFYDDFEDGDYTNNPAWSPKHPPVDAEVSADPVRSNNHTLRSYGSYTGEQILESYLDYRIPWSELDFSVEFFASTENYHSFFGVISEDYSLRMELQHTSDMEWVEFVVWETNSQNKITPDIASPINEWWKLHLWYDNELGKVFADIRLANDNTLLAEQSFVPWSVMSTAQDISYVDLSFGLPDWQYVDNVVLTPEPATLSLFAFGLLALRKRKS